MLLQKLFQLVKLGVQRQLGGGCSVCVLRVSELFALTLSNLVLEQFALSVVFIIFEFVTLHETTGQFGRTEEGEFNWLGRQLLILLFKLGFATHESFQALIFLNVVRSRDHYRTGTHYLEVWPGNEFGRRRGLSKNWIAIFLRGISLNCKRTFTVLTVLRLRGGAQLGLIWRKQTCTCIDIGLLQIFGVAVRRFLSRRKSNALLGRNIEAAGSVRIPRNFKSCQLVELFLALLNLFNQNLLHFFGKQHIRIVLVNALDAGARWWIFYRLSIANFKLRGFLRRIFLLVADFAEHLIHVTFLILAFLLIDHFFKLIFGTAAEIVKNSLLKNMLRGCLNLSGGFNLALSWLFLLFGGWFHQNERTSFLDSLLNIERHRVSLRLCHTYNLNFWLLLRRPRFTDQIQVYWGHSDPLMNILHKASLLRRHMKTLLWNWVHKLTLIYHVFILNESLIFIESPFNTANFLLFAEIFTISQRLLPHMEPNILSIDLYLGFSDLIEIWRTHHLLEWLIVCTHLLISIEIRIPTLLHWQNIKSLLDFFVIDPKFLILLWGGLFLRSRAIFVSRRNQMINGGHYEHNHSPKRISGFNILHQIFIWESIHGINSQKS